MKFFLVISIIALWWVPMNSPGNVGITSLSHKLKIYPGPTLVSPENKVETTLTKRKMDHFGTHIRRRLKNKIH